MAGMIVFHAFVCMHRSNQNSGVKMDPSTLVLTYSEGENEYELLDDSQFLYPDIFSSTTQFVYGRERECT